MITIRRITPIITAPQKINLVVVKVETSEPGLYGLGCATFTQRYEAVATAVRDHLAPLMVGRDAQRIEENWQLMYQHSYWRNGPVLNNAIAGIDIALWDIKAKLANMPLYQLLGGKVREGAAVYLHAQGCDNKELEDRARFFLSKGVHYIRIQRGKFAYGGMEYDGIRPEGSLPGAYYDQRGYMHANLAAMEHIRNVLGDRVEILHDVHERLSCAQAVDFAKQCEKLRMFFLEDALAPEDIEWFANIRQACTTPIAMGELFNHPREWTPLITGRLIDFMRMHITQMGGLTPARKVAMLGELHGVKTAWHGPGDVSPVGHMLNVHLDVVSPNFGIQEFSPNYHWDPKQPLGMAPQLLEVFPGCPELRNGYLYPNDKPGIGVDLDEKAAAKYPGIRHVDEWTQARLPDGSLHRP